MNRLWVRLSLIFSSLILVFSLLPLAAFIIFLFTHEPPTTGAIPAAAAIVSPLAAPGNCCRSWRQHYRRCTGSCAGHCAC